MACGGGCCGSKDSIARPITSEVPSTTSTQHPTEMSSNLLTVLESTPVANTTSDNDCEITCSSSAGSEPVKPTPTGSCCHTSSLVKATTGEGCCSGKLDKPKRTSSCCPIEAPESARDESSTSCCRPSSPSEAKQPSSCCQSSPPGQAKTTEACCSSSSNNPATTSSCSGATKQDCCKSDTQSISDKTCGNSCCEQEDSVCVEAAPAPGTTCRTSQPTGCITTQTKPSCCGLKKTALVDTTESTPSDVDIEKGGPTREHVVISVSGMTCTGCETKLQRTLGSLPYVSNLQTSLVLARVEFDIDASVATADDVIKHLHRTTEFKCERVSNQGCSLDLICSGDPTAFVNRQWPDGVLEVRLTDKQTIRVDYDAKIIGARDFLDNEWSQPLQLAPPCPDASLDAGSKHVRHTGLLTLLSAILTIPVLVMAWAPLPDREITYGSASLALATIMQVVIAGPFYPKAIKALVFSRVIEMDLLRY